MRKRRVDGSNGNGANDNKESARDYSNTRG